MAGKFITLEGLDGVGKSTQMAGVRALLGEAGVEFVATREPGGTPLAEAIRKLVLTPSKEPIAATAELLLIFAARSQHLETVIHPALKAGLWVVCERFTDATYAYQGGGRGVSAATIAQLEQLVQGGLQPDLTIFLDAPVELVAERLVGRSADRFERKTAAFFTRVRESYLALAQRRNRFVVVRGDAAQADVRAAIADVLGPLLATAREG